MTCSRAVLSALMAAGLALGMAGPAGAQQQYTITADPAVSYQSETDGAAWAFLEAVLGEVNTYDGEALFVGGTWVGPTNWAGYYAVGDSPWARAGSGPDGSIGPVVGDGKLEVPLTGNLSIDRGVDGVFCDPATNDDVISGTITVGATVRAFSGGLGVRAEEEWSSLILALDAADGEVDFNTPDGGGGCDYVIGTAGDPGILQANGGTAEFADDLDIGLAGADSYDAPAAFGISSIEDFPNIGAPMSVATQNYACVKSSGPCEAGDSTHDTDAATEGTRGGGLENTIWVVSVDANGDIDSAYVFPVDEAVTAGQPVWTSPLWRFAATCDNCKPARDDNATTVEGVPVTIDFLANDSVTDPTDVTLANGGVGTLGGTFTLNGTVPGDPAQIDVTYTDPGGIAGQTDTIDYTIDSGGVQDTATISVLVEVDVDPVAPDAQAPDVDTTGVAPETATSVIDVAAIPGVELGNAPTTVSITAQGVSGTATVAGTVITYTPDDTSFFEPPDTFTYQIEDAQGPGTADTGDITVDYIDTDPALADSNEQTDENTDLVLDLAAAGLVTAGNGELSDHTISIDTNPMDGMAVVNGAVLTYTPDPGFVGNDEVILAIIDGDGSGTDTGTIFITVNAAGQLQIKLPGGSSALSPLSLLLLLGLPLLRRRRRG